VIALSKNASVNFLKKKFPVELLISQYKGSVFIPDEAW